MEDDFFQLSRSFVHISELSENRKLVSHKLSIQVLVKYLGLAIVADLKGLN